MMNVEHWDGAEALFRRERVRTDPEVSAAVAQIIEDVRTRGDTALREYTKRFDGFPLNAENILVSDKEFEEAYGAVSDEWLLL